MSIVTPGTAILVRVLILACCSQVFAVSLARADVPPINACTAPGQPCGAGEACTCQASSCTRQLPCNEEPADEDGGSSELCTATYDCGLCMTSRGAACPTEGGTDDAGARGDAGIRKDKKDDDGCSCASGSGISGGGLAVTFALWWRGRRRSNV